MITYRKTSQGEWVAFGPASEIKAGSDITVAKKSGERETRHVNAAGKPFLVDGVKMVYGYLADREISEEKRQAGFAAMWSGTASVPAPRKPARQQCAECGERAGRHERRDSSGIPGLVCDRCDREPSHALSFA